MLKYTNFFSELLLESIINESVIFFSRKMRNLLNNIDNPIATDLLNVEATDIKPDITYVDYTIDKDPTLTFITMKNALNKIKNQSWYEIYDRRMKGDSKSDKIQIADEIYDGRLAGVYSESRNEVKIGKLVNKIFPGKYNAKQLEEFTNIFKSSIAKIGERFELVQGSDISSWYSHTRYASGGGTLNNSCMRGSSSSIFDIYVNNPQVCKMLILVENDKLLGRAIVWKISGITNPDTSDNKKIKEKIDNGEFYLMDRIYTVKDSDIIKFKNYAKEKGWATKTVNSYTSPNSVDYNDREYSYVKLFVKIENKTNNLFPYMDTFKLYDSDDKILYNISVDDDGRDKYIGYYLLTSTGGSYDIIEDSVWSEWYDEDIPRNEAVWSDYMNSYLNRHNSIHVEGRDDWMPEDHDDLVYSDRTGSYYIYDDTNWSDVYDTYIPEDSAIDAIDDHMSEGEPVVTSNYMDNDRNLVDLGLGRYNLLWVTFLDDKFGYWRDELIHDSLLTKNYKDQYILKAFTILVYRVIEESFENSEELYLSEVDADILGYKIDKAKYRKIDKFEYNHNIKNLLNDIIETAHNKIKKIRADRKQLDFNFFPEDKKIFAEKQADRIKKYTERIDEIENKTFYAFVD